MYGVLNPFLSMKNKKNKDGKEKSILLIVNDIDFFLSHRKKIGLKTSSKLILFAADPNNKRKL